MTTIMLDPGIVAHSELGTPLETGERIRLPLGSLVHIATGPRTTRDYRVVGIEYDDRYRITSATEIFPTQYAAGIVLA